MQNRVGDEFSGTITSVASFGLFIELSDYYVEGLVHITELSNDYYHFDPVRHLLQGERSGLTYQLGDSVTVRLVKEWIWKKKRSTCRWLAAEDLGLLKDDCARR